MGTIRALFPSGFKAQLARGRILTPPPERRIHPAGRRAALGLPDESGVPIGIAARLGGGVKMRPLEVVVGQMRREAFVSASGITRTTSAMSFSLVLVISEIAEVARRLAGL
jgi:hypothetical protein